MTPHQTPPGPALPTHGPNLVLQKTYLALVISAEAHHGQLRKNQTPYLLHPLAVWQVLVQADVLEPDILMLGLLHDVLEERPLDAYLFEQRMAQELGPDVARHVRWLTDKAGGSTEQRKRDQLRKLRHAPWPVRVVKLADRLTNLNAGPAPGWTVAKTRSYAEHSQALLGVLQGTHAALESGVKAALAHEAWGLNLPELEVPHGA